MDLYEAIKNGTSQEELMTAFRADLDKAKARIEEEQKQKAQEEADAFYLEDCRSDLAGSIVAYLEALKKVDLSNEEFTKECLEVEKILKTFEKSYGDLKNGPLVDMWLDIFDNGKKEDVNIKLPSSFWSLFKRLW